MEVGIFIYDGAECLDFCGPLEVFNTAKRFIETPINVSLVAPSHIPVTSRGGMSVNPHYSIYSHPKFDLLIVVGGLHHQICGDHNVLNWLAETANHTSQCASVCTGVFLYAEAGLIDGKRVTTHWQDIDDLREQYPSLEVVEDVRFIMDQNFTSSAGISAGIDMSLELVKKRFGQSIARKTATQMDYDWPRS
ncbi:glutamine amidotransferase [Pseudoalteromonas sp. HM-SA03]|uniref:DJ-1/PfpI family protein n=1 Tax=Pseudoalteromonas sp. HM-SA03 TaxID=2029678 RepID=UPI000BAE0BB2|nr:DJ-1/PfpI family protein [Pseudoalteromonas sp. HM-SA03]PAY01882.1 glutamine amidotransferase [Pseudoalteromonas sp. HM-SA03]